VGKELLVVGVKLLVDLGDVPVNSCSECPQGVEVVPEGLSGGNAVNGCQAHDGFKHQMGVLNLVEGVLVAVDEEPGLGIGGQQLGEAGGHHGAVCLV
jgi:hypothetical protein